MSLSTSELRASLALCPPEKVFFTDRFKVVLLLWTILLFIFRVCLVFLSVLCNLVVTCLERTDLLALLYMMFYRVSGVLDQVWCLIVSIPEICLLFTTFIPKNISDSSLCACISSKV